MDFLDMLWKGFTKVGEYGQRFHDDHNKAYDSSDRMSDDELRERVRDSSLSYGERSGYMKRYKENHPDKYNK